MSKNLVLEEKLNMGKAMQLNEEVKTVEFKEWVTEKINVCETFLSIAIHNKITEAEARNLCCMYGETLSKNMEVSGKDIKIAGMLIRMDIMLY